VKLGTQVVTQDGRSLALGRLMSLVEEMALLRLEGRQIVLVSSGAVALGMKQLGLDERPRSLGLRQACAAVGQGHLVALYTSAFAQFGVIAAQVLLTESDLGDRDRALCVRTTLMRLLELRAVPVLNENDSVSIRELVEHRQSQGAATGAPAFGDNDGLSARVAIGVDADLLVLLTDVDGLYTDDPSVNARARKLDTVDAITDEIVGLARDRADRVSVGGMATKLQAARKAAAAGVPMVIASGREPGVLRRILDGESVGTYFAPKADRLGARKRWIAFAVPPQGRLTVDAGALAALTQRGKSLLPSGIVEIEGDFDSGEVVALLGGAGGKEFARGVVNFDATELRKIRGAKTQEIEHRLGYKSFDEVIHRDNLVIL